MRINRNVITCGGIKKWTGVNKHYFIVSKLIRGEKIMKKVISFEDYKKSKEEKLKANCNKKPKNRYIEAYKNMDEETKRMINSLLSDEM